MVESETKDRDLIERIDGHWGRVENRPISRESLSPITQRKGPFIDRGTAVMGASVTSRHWNTVLKIAQDMEAGSEL